MRKRTKAPSTRDTIMVRVEVRRRYHEEIKRLARLDKTPIYKTLGEALAAGLPQVRQRVKNDFAEKAKRKRDAKHTGDPKNSWIAPTETDGHPGPATTPDPEPKGGGTCAT